MLKCLIGKAFSNFKWLADHIYIVFVGMTLVLMLTGCQSSPLSSGTWKTYHNSRYGFEFPYPSGWVSSATPDNRDGQAFSDPQNPSAEIRGWAGVSLAVIITPHHQKSVKSIVKPLKNNFITQQGVIGHLQVDVNTNFSTMMLELPRGEIIYHLQGRSPSQKFGDYYPIFANIARQYRIPLNSEKS